MCYGGWCSLASRAWRFNRPCIGLGDGLKNIYLTCLDLHDERKLYFLRRIPYRRILSVQYQYRLVIGRLCWRVA